MGGINSPDLARGLGRRFHEAAMRHDDRLTVGWHDLEQRQRDTYDAAAADVLAPAAGGDLAALRRWLDEQIEKADERWRHSVFAEDAADHTATARAKTLREVRARLAAAPASEAATEGGEAECPTCHADVEVQDSGVLGPHPGDYGGTCHGSGIDADVARGVAGRTHPATPREQGTAEAATEGHSIRDRLAGDEGLTGDEQLAVSPDAARCTPGGEG